MLLAVGTYTKGTDSNTGIHFYEIKSGFSSFELTHTAEIADASFFTLSTDNQKLYAVNEHAGANDTITAARYSSTDVIPINTVTASGSAPCYITVNKGLTHAFVANYSSGTLYAVAINDDGSLASNGQVIKYDGSGPDPRQEAAHIHCAILSPDERYLLVSDLGTDHIYIHRYHPEKISEPLQQIEAVKLNPGTGPRHIIFSADSRFVYVVGEVNATINVFSWDDGSLKPVQTVDMMPEDYTGFKSAAEIKLSPDGCFLYASQRGTANMIVIFKINKADGTLSLVDRQSTKGYGPRNFVIDPSGKYLVVAHQQSNDVRVFEINADGTLTSTDTIIPVSHPVFLRFIN